MQLVKLTVVAPNKNDDGTRSERAEWFHPDDLRRVRRTANGEYTAIQTASQSGATYVAETPEQVNELLTQATEGGELRELRKVLDSHLRIMTFHMGEQ